MSTSPRESHITLPSSDVRLGDRSKRDLLFRGDSLVSSIIASETQTELGPAIQSLFEQGKQEDAIAELTSYVKRLEREIEKICTQNYQVG